MEIKVVNNTGINVRVKKSDDGKSITLYVDEINKNNVPLGEIKCGKVVRIGGIDYIVLDHSAETTAIIAKSFAKEMKFGKDGKYGESDVRKYLNGEFYDGLAKAVGAENIIRHTVHLTADDGTNVGVSCRDNVSLLTTELYRRYRQYLPAYGRWWWLATPVSNHKDYAGCVCNVGSDGVLLWSGSGYCGGVRPFCILNSSILNFEVVES